VHINTWLHPRFIPKILPVIATIHHAIHHPDALSYKGWQRAAYHKYWIAPIERRVMHRADKVIAVSQFVAHTAKQTLVDVPMQVIYNGIDTEIFKPGNRIRQTGKPFRLLYVGSWMARKGVDLLAPIMRELGDGFELHYTGGPTAEKDKANMPSNMKDIGRLQEEVDVVARMQDADALLFPSRSEGHPLVGIEAMACGLPVIATLGSSVSEAVKDGVTGVLCSPNDTAYFAAAIRDLASNPEKLQKIADTARAETIKHFRVTNLIEAYFKIYRTVLPS
jgi:glycosyltransferase involved in cell wall biosynthesis